MPCDPAAPAELRDDHGDERDERAEADEEPEDVALGLLAAPRDEAHVVDDHQRAEDRVVGTEALDRDVQRALGAGEQARLAVDEAVQVVAGDVGGEVARAGELPTLRVAEADRVQALVLRDAVEERGDLRPRVRAHELGERLLDGVGDQLRADVEVAHEPLAA